MITPKQVMISVMKIIKIIIMIIAITITITIILIKITMKTIIIR